MNLPLRHAVNWLSCALVWQGFANKKYRYIK
jgi:hypothetical protein